VKFNEDAKKGKSFVGGNVFGEIPSGRWNKNPKPSNKVNRRNNGRKRKRLGARVLIGAHWDEKSGWKYYGLPQEKPGQKKAGKLYKGK